MTQSPFALERWFPRDLYEKICEIRTDESFASLITKRKIDPKRMRKKLTLNGRLTILAADHPARMVIGDKQTPLGNRYELLGRILRVLSLERWDGVMVTPDIFEDLIIIQHLLKTRKGKNFLNSAFPSSFLDDKVIIGSMNRGGLADTSFELDDRFTAFTAKSIQLLGLDGAKIMLRLDPSNSDSGKTLDYCTKAIEELAVKRIPIFFECLWVNNENKPIKEAEKLIKVVSVAQALGSPPRELWFKLPYCDGFEKVAQATTCPILLLGGSTKETGTFLKEIKEALGAGSNVRGVLAGRNVLFPQDGQDPMEVAQRILRIVREG